MPRKIRPLIERLMEKVRVSDNGCWEWTGETSRNGYGRIRLGEGRPGKAQAHRASFEIHVGPIPDGLQLDHLCRNRGCVNPAHLEPVTSRQNVLRGEAPAAKNARKTSCNRGHPLYGYNLIIENNGHRRCRACRIAEKRAAYARAKAGAK